MNDILILSVLGMAILFWRHVVEGRGGFTVLGMMCYFLLLPAWSLHWFFPAILLVLLLIFTVWDVLRTIDFMEYNSMRMLSWVTNAALLIMFCLRTF